MTVSNQHSGLDALRRLEARGGWDEGDLNDFAVVEGLLEQLEVTQRTLDERLSFEAADRYLAHRFNQVYDERDRLEEQLQTREKQLLEIAEKGYERTLQKAYEDALEQLEALRTAAVDFLVNEPLQITSGRWYALAEAVLPAAKDLVNDEIVDALLVSFPASTPDTTPATESVIERKAREQRESLRGAPPSVLPDPDFDAQTGGAMSDVEDRVEDVMQYVHDFHEVNQEWPTRKDYANFLGVESRALPGVRAAINRNLLGYLAGDRLAPREVVDADFEAWLAARETQNQRSEPKEGA